MTGRAAALRVLVPDGTPVISVASLGTSLGASRLREVPSGGTLALYDDRPAAAFRLRRALRDVDLSGDLDVGQEYVVLPTWRHGTFFVEDSPGTMAWLWETFATVPPGLSRGSLPVSVLVRVARRFPALLRLLGQCAPGRLAIVSRR